MFSVQWQRGTSMIEVLVTMVIVALGLLGLAGLQSRLQVAEVESYQRAQALILLTDMANRLSTNRGDAANYVTASPLGTGMTNCPVTNGTSTRQQLDAAQWCTSLIGAAEILGGAKAGAMIGGRGCIANVGTNEYLITVAWQGQTPVSAPPSGIPCGQGQYDSAGAGCTGDLCRRVVTTLVRIASLG